MSKVFMRRQFVVSFVLSILLLVKIQSSADNRTSSVIDRPFWPITGYTISGQTYFGSITELQSYSGDSKTGPSGIRAILKPNFLKFGFGMVYTILKPDLFVRFQDGQRLDRFGMNKNFFMTLFFIKRSRLAATKTILKPDKLVRFQDGQKLDRFGMNKIFL